MPPRKKIKITPKQNPNPTYSGPQPRLYEWNGADFKDGKLKLKDEETHTQYKDKGREVPKSRIQKRAPFSGPQLFADLNTSYVPATTATTAPNPPAPPAKQAWPAGARPITDIAKVPPGWNYDEPDLDPEDWAAQITRCNERIVEGIMPDIFRWKLEELTRSQESRKEMVREAGAQGITDINVLKRLCTLKRTLKNLQGGKDEYKLISTVKAIITAYENKTLDWYDGLVTYWSHGTQLSQPRTFIAEEHQEIGKHYNGYEGFWVEGVFGPGPTNTLFCKHFETQPSSNRNIFSHYMDLHLRVPNAQIAGHPITFIDDTGSDMMVMYDADKRLLERLGGRRLLCLGMAQAAQADGHWSDFLVVSVEVTIYCKSPARNNQGHLVRVPNGGYRYITERMTSWDTIQCAVRPGAAGVDDVPRLLGPWLRYKLYTASAPDGQNRMHIMDNYSGFGNHVPNVDTSLAIQQGLIVNLDQVPDPFIPPPPYR
ncbi:hypothetical protein N7467_005475 [Penicillium canescens]|nr:hypothetical protein N7467_005475 [Penicillium canescens]